MQKIYFVLILIAQISLTYASISDIPSKDLMDRYQGENERIFNEIYSIKETRESLFYGVWDIARQEKVDDRAYLFSLAIDLYNSLPPGQDPTGYNPGEIGGKGELMSIILSAINYSGGLPERAWDRSVKRKSQWGKELAYIYFYLRENIKLDHFSKPASLDPVNIDLKNPTHYTELKEFMEKSRDAITKGVPPWETEKQVSVAKAKDKQPVSIVEQPKPIVNTKQQPETKPDALPIDKGVKKPNKQLYLILVLLLAIGVVLLLYLRRRGKS